MFITPLVLFEDCIYIFLRKEHLHGLQYRYWQNIKHGIHVVCTIYTYSPKFEFIYFKTAKNNRHNKMDPDTWHMMANRNVVLK